MATTLLARLSKFYPPGRKRHHMPAYIGFGLIVLAALLAVKLNSPESPPQVVQQPEKMSTPTASLQPTTQPTITSTPRPLPSPLTTKDVLVLSYFPLTPDGRNIDKTVTGDVGEPLELIRKRTQEITRNLANNIIPKATTYAGQVASDSTPSILMNVIETKEFLQAVPFDPTTREPRYDQIMADNRICDYVERRGVDEVFMWAYQGPDHFAGKPYLRISESKMAGPHGDYSNSYSHNNMPVCARTYVVYTFNYQRGTAEAMHSWSHQIEAEMRAAAPQLFAAYQGKNAPANARIISRCGSVHHPPNSRHDYDYANPNPQVSDCLAWQPGRLGQTTAISCINWGCNHVDDLRNPQLNYLVWYWQHLPGMDNQLQFQGKPLGNLWRIHADFDQAMREQANP